MTIPRIYTEDQFPLHDNPAITDDQLPEDVYSFPVLVDWDDTDESPRQAVVRLNREVMEQSEEATRLHRKLRTGLGIFQVLNQFVVRAQQGSSLRTIEHTECGLQVATLPDKDVLVGNLVDVLRQHDCTVAARIEASENGRIVAGRAVGLLDGSDETMDPEYLRALTEMVAEAAGLPPERKAEVAAYLWEQASTTGTLPTI